MDVANKKEPVLLFFGDMFFWYLSLWFTIFLRYGGDERTQAFDAHFLPFSILFAVWALVFFIAGLYEKHTLIFKTRLPSAILNTVFSNSIIAVAFFYFIPLFGITPKTNLFLYLIISFCFVVLWRLYLAPAFSVKKKEKAILIGSGREMHELNDEVNNNKRYNLVFVSSLDLNQIDGVDFKREILDRVYTEGISVVVIDIANSKIKPILPHLYNLIFLKVRFVDMYKVYEDIFDRVPLSLVRYNWFLENISTSRKLVYDFFKRLMDVTIVVVLGVISLVLYPFVALAIKIDDGGGVFSFQKRVGQNNKLVEIMKFRTMRFPNDDAKWGTTDNKITRVGAFLRKSRIDELPQLWNVLKGDISLIGPRPEFERAVREYADKIPYYNIRHIIKPGLSGWAQIYHERHPHHGVDIDETRNKLSYDLYYIKNRSLVLDLKIALKTIKTLLLRSGV